MGVNSGCDLVPVAGYRAGCDISEKVGEGE